MKSAVLDRYIECLKTFNEHTNIYSKKAYDHLPFHMQDSVNIAMLIGDKPLNIVDLGSGSGFPSIPIAVMNPENKVVAIESNGKKAHFLQQTATELGLKNYAVLQMDANQLHREKLPIDAITAKAFKPLSEVVSLAKRIARHAKLIVPLSLAQVSLLSDSEKIAIQEQILTDTRYFYYMIPTRN